MKKLYKILIIALAVLSAAGNLYWFGSQAWNKQKNRWFNAGIIKVFEVGKSNGQVSYTQDGKTITLILEGKCPKILE